jgi:hypothetical protein
MAWIAAMTGTLAAIVQLAGWYANAHRYAVGTDGSWLFVGGAEWSPAGGWVPWLVLAVSGTTLLVLAARTPRASSATQNATTEDRTDLLRASTPHIRANEADSSRGHGNT